MIQTFISIIHVGACLILMGVVLLQQGKGGGMGSAFGGASAQVFGGSGAGNILTRATAICAGIFMVTSVTLAYMSSSGDRALKAKVAMESGKKKDRGTPREKDSAATPPPSGAPAGSGAAVPPVPTSPGSPAKNP